MSEISREHDGKLRELCDDLKRWQRYYDPVDDKGQHEMFVSAADAVTELLALRNEREAAVPVYQERRFHVSGKKQIEYWAEITPGGYKYLPESERRIVYLAPPVQPVAVPDEPPEHLLPQGASNDASYRRGAIIHGWRLCRAAMLAETKDKKWISVDEAMPDPKSEQRVCVYTPSPHEDVRYRFVPASMFRTVCSSATHWHYMEPPEFTEE